MLIDRGSSACGVYEPSLDIQVLRGCRNCRAPHPLALKVQPADRTKCSVCGFPVLEVTETQHVGAVLGGISPAIIFANFCFWAAGKIAATIKLIERN